ncbi:MAG: 2,3-cyclic 3-phosphodiesterase [Candidatus Sumerlaeota bacterium]|nr:2,3-cyclic 3-phosphodiesterase [Candidatus Sumerlaeota bacterium]
MINENPPSAPVQPDGSQATKRVFFALPLDDARRAVLADMTERLAKAARFTPAEISWVPPANFHLTLHFLGAVPVPTVERLIAALPAAARDVPPFELRLRGIGYFPHHKAPRVFWAGVSRPLAGLMALHNRIARLIESEGLTLQHDNFHAHITLARFRSLRGTYAFSKLAAPHKDAEFGTAPANRVLLMESTLRPEGPHYTAIGEGALG